MSRLPGHKKVIIRDLIIFQLKLAVDGLKNVFLLPASLVAALIDLLLPGTQPGRLFYRVMRLGETFDQWLSLYGPAHQAQASLDGLFGASRAGAATLLGELEEFVRGPEDPRSRPGGSIRRPGSRP
ncbi:MAG: hypothetical protein FIB01_06700 [Gemmatimonadetes bacterium]|nr:hypothetical protein [Gemmatimonadota bacterium]